MAPHPDFDPYAPPPPAWDPKYVGRKPDYTGATFNDLFPTSISTWNLPTYTALPTINWASDLEASSSDTSMFSITSYHPNRAPAEPTETPQYEQHGGRRGLSSAVLGAAGAISTLAILCILAGICLCMCRRSRKRRQAAQRNGPNVEMAQTTSNSSNAQYDDTRAYIRPPSTEPPASLNSPSIITPTSTTNLTRPEAPVLLSTTIDQSYYTGIDTSDGLSMDDSRRLSVATAAPGYASSTISEPPPPYRPRSVVSRESSMRLSVAPPSYGPRLSVRSTNMNVVTSPFDDPEDDGHVSDSAPSPMTSEAPQIRDMEEMSDVSELSYQQDPVVAHSTV
jgi:hypothetical protein